MEHLGGINDKCDEMLEQFHAVNRSRIAEIDHEINSLKLLAQELNIEIAIK